jgi:hypothetical protein
MHDAAWHKDRHSQEPANALIQCKTCWSVLIFFRNCQEKGTGTLIANTFSVIFSCIETRRDNVETGNHIRRRRSSSPRRHREIFPRSSLGSGQPCGIPDYCRPSFLRRIFLVSDFGRRRFAGNDRTSDGQVKKNLIITGYKGERTRGNVIILVWKDLVG